MDTTPPGEDYDAAIAELRDKAVRAGADLGAMNPPSHLAKTHTRACAAQTALYQATHRNISLAVAGGFNTGKTLLTSVLLDLPALLPVRDAPATGNVTRMRLRTGPTAAITGSAISLMPSETVAEMVDFILSAIVDTVGQDRAYHGLRALRGKRIVDVENPAASDWSALEAALAQAWQAPSVDMGVQHWGTELLGIRDALRVGGHLLPRRLPGPEIAVAEANLPEALLIGDSRVVPEHTSGPAGYRPPITSAQVSSPQGLRAVFPLIHEVVLDVDVDPAVWPIARADVDLLDFPGQGAKSKRDDFMIDAELATATVVVFLLDAEEPQSDRLMRIHTALDHGRRDRRAVADSLVVVANRFDRVIPPAVSPTSAAEVVEQSAGLRRLMLEADLLTRKRRERVVLVSALAAAGDRELTVPGAKSQDQHSDSRQRWARALDRLPEAHESEPPIPALRGYIADHGVRAARDLLTQHLLRYGRTIVLDEARAIETELDGLLELLTPVRQDAAGPGDRERMRSLLVELTKAVHHTRDRLGDIRLLSGLTVPGPGRETVTLDEELRARAAQLVHSWPLWPETIRLAADPSWAGQTADTPWDDWDDDTPSDDEDWPDIDTSTGGDAPEAVALTTRPLLAHYHASAATLAQEAETLLDASLAEWLADVRSADVVVRAAQRFGRDTAPTDDRRTLERRLRTINAPDLVRQRLSRVDALLAGSTIVQVPESRRPRPGGGPEPAQPHRALPWHPDLPEIEAGGLAELAHPFTALRIRHDFVVALHRETCRYAQQMLDRVYATARGRVESIDKKYLPSAAEQQRMNGESR